MKKRIPSIISMLTLVLIAALLMQSLCPTVSAAGSSVEITSDGQIVDTFNGVPARYIRGSGNSNTGTYSCAGYVKAYYSQVFGVSVYNLLSGRTPAVSQSGYSFRSISSDIRPGDVVRLPGHWAIIKAVSGNTLTLIEQNWKWVSNSRTYASVNRTVTLGSTSGLAVFALYRGNTRVNGGSAENASINYWVHVQNYGTMNTVSNGATAGTTGKSLRVEDLAISLSGISGGLSYRAHVSNIGWKSWVSSGSCGTQGQSLQMEAVQIKLTGQAASKYSVMYRVHVQNYGWMGWVKDGAVAGTTGQGLRIEAIEIKLVRK